MDNYIAVYQGIDWNCLMPDAILSGFPVNTQPILTNYLNSDIRGLQK